MKIEIIGEYGYKQAMKGLSLSYKTTVKRTMEIAPSLAKKDHGHNKFLEHIDIWLDITAPRYWWQEADTYRLSTKQSESTMHTLLKRPITQEDFERSILPETLMYINDLIYTYKETKSEKTFLLLKANLPEGFLQRRIWKLSYKNLREIILQRHNHRLPEWREMFCPYILQNVEHPELLQLH